jgi:methionyl-tRNA formyltransferase
MPAPGAFFELDGERYKVLSARIVEGSGEAGSTLDDALTVACGEQALQVTRIQRAGKPAMDVADLLRGRPIPAGTKLG